MDTTANRYRYMVLLLLALVLLAGGRAWAVEPPIFCSGDISVDYIGGWVSGSNAYLEALYCFDPYLYYEIASSATYLRFDLGTVGAIHPDDVTGATLRIWSSYFIGDVTVARETDDAWSEANETYVPQGTTTDATAHSVTAYNTVQNVDILAAVKAEVGAGDTLLSLEIAPANIGYWGSWHGASFLSREADPDNRPRLLLTVTNHAPVAVADAYDVLEDGTLTITAGTGVLANDTDADADTLTATVVSNPSHGTLMLNPTGAFTYTPQTNYNGPDSFTYRAVDNHTPHNASSASTTVTLTVAPVNDQPSFTLAAGLAPITPTGTAQTIPGVIATTDFGPNDEDPGGAHAQAVDDYEVTIPPESANLFTVEPDISNTGTLTYTPAADAAGTVEVTVRLRDNGGTANGGVNTSEPLSFTLTIVKVAALEYKIGTGAFTAVPTAPTPLYVPLGVAVTFKALKSPTGVSWPAGKPVWTGATANPTQADQATQTFTTAGTYSVTAECGNSETANIAVYYVEITYCPDYFVPNHNNIVKYRIFPNDFSATYGKISIFARDNENHPVGNPVYVNQNVPLQSGVENTFIYNGTEINSDVGQYIIYINVGSDDMLTSSDEGSFNVAAWNLLLLTWDVLEDEEKTTIDQAYDEEESEYNGLFDSLEIDEGEAVQPPYCTGIKAETLITGRVSIYIWYWDETEDNATIVQFSAGQSTQDIPELSWVSDLGMSMETKSWCDERGGAISELYANFFSVSEPNYLWIKVVVQEDGILDNEGNEFDADANTTSLEKTIKFKIIIDGEGIIDTIEEVVE